MAAPAQQNTVSVSDFERFLTDHGFLSREAFDKLQLAKRDTPANTPAAVDDLLLSGKFLDEENLAKARAAFLNLPYVDLHGKDIPASVLSMIPEESRTFYQLVPFELAGSVLKVALSDPSNLQVLEALEFLGQKQNLQVQVYVASGA